MIVGLALVIASPKRVPWPTPARALGSTRFRHPARGRFVSELQVEVGELGYWRTQTSS